MVCDSCVRKLASKLVAHHKNLGWIRALELAEKGVMRYEALTGKGNPSDYTQPCDPNPEDYPAGKSAPCPDGGNMCMIDENCSEMTAVCSCPSPLANSHLVSDDCVRVIDLTCQRCILEFPYYCRYYGNYHCTGNCYYDCDEGYEWNPATEQCELVAPPPAKPLINKPLINPKLVNVPIIR